MDYRSKNLTCGHWPGVAGWLWKLGERLFAEQDADARDRGWQVERIQGGLGRTYRDPRYDRRVICPACGGSGWDQDFGPAQWCVACRGVGVVTKPRVIRRHIFGSSEACGDLSGGVGMVVRRLTELTERRPVVRRPTVRWPR